MRKSVFAGFAGGKKTVELVEELVGPELIGIGNLEIREEWIEMIAQFDLRSDIFGKHGNCPGIRTGTAARITDIFFERLAFLDHRRACRLNPRLGAARWAQYHRDCRCTT